jgi:hypothetical protein
MKHYVTDIWLEERKGAMDNLDSQYSLSYKNRHLHRRENLRHFINTSPTDYEVMGQTCKLKLEELCNPEDPYPYRGRLTRFISALAPLMGSTKGFKAGRDRSNEYAATTPTMHCAQYSLLTLSRWV